jgi:hypothetical protein
MLTIRAMAQMGPWLLNLIEHLDEGYEHCQRCETKIKWIWVMEKQTEPKERWRIGCECGPQLEDMCQELWDTVAKPFKNCIPHVRKLDRLLLCERDYPELCPSGYQLGWAEQQVARYAAGGLTARDRKLLGMQVSRNEKRYVAAVRNLFAAQRKAADSLHTTPHH